jgi:nucleoid-associated protein YgaU
MSRYNSRRKGINDSEMYENIFDDRGVQEIQQYVTPRLKFPTEQELLSIRYVNYTWKQGDKFWRLASAQYGNPSLWWVIAQFNRKPTEAHLNSGDVIKIPLDLGIILGAMG